MSGSSSRIIRNPVRTSCWSSTRRTRIGIVRPVAAAALAAGRTAGGPNPEPARHRPSLEPATEHGDPLTHPDEAATRLARDADAAVTGPAPVGHHRYRARPRPVANTDLAVAPRACFRAFVSASWMIR